MADEVAPGAQVEQAETLGSVSTQLRLWPGVVLPIVMLGCVFVPGLLFPATMAQFMLMMGGPFGGALIAGLWWLFASRAPRRERTTIFLVFLAGLAIGLTLGHPSMRIGMFLFALPTVLLAASLLLMAMRSTPGGGRLIGVCVVILVGWGVWSLVRLDGLDGSVWPQLSWRWTQTAEQRYLASLQAGLKLAADNTTPAADKMATADWPGFRGPRRDSRADGERIATDWSQSPPQQLWRRPAGPSWSSFAVVGNRLYTQEQRGEQEVVQCLDADSGADLWVHPTSTRFSEVIGGAGPRATPTVVDGKVYALGANGALLCLSAEDGSPLWTRQLAEDSGADVPTWGFSSSPLLAGELVIVFAGGTENNSVLAYHAESGEVAWTGGSGAHTYSSPHYAELAGMPQVLMLTEQGLDALDLLSGETLWRHAWPVPAYRVVQPIVFDDGVLIGSVNNLGTRRLRVARDDSGGLQVDTVWTSKRLKPYFNDFVLHQGHVYGFDHSILACIGLADGERLWKGGRYGTGQLVLLPEQDLLVVVTEKTGEVVLVGAQPEGHRELGRFTALEGKTWNHPVVAGGRLYLRNGEQAVCFDLSAPD